MDSEQFNRFDSHLNALRDYQLYRGWTEVDETENLPAGTYASIVRSEVTYSLEEVEEEGDERPTESAETMMEF